MIFRGSPSVLTKFGALFLAFLLFAGGLTGYFLVPETNKTVKYLLGGLAAVALVHMIIVIVLVKATQYEITSERIRVRRGILTKRTDELELYRANDTSLIEPITMRVFGLGTIEIRTMDTTNPTLYIEAVHGARRVRESLRKHIEACRDRKGVRVTEFDNPGTAPGPSPTS